MQSSSRKARGGDETEFEHVLLNGACAETPSRSQLIEKVVWGKTQACQAEQREGAGFAWSSAFLAWLAFLDLSHLTHQPQFSAIVTSTCASGMIDS